MQPNPTFIFVPSTEKQLEKVINLAAICDYSFCPPKNGRPAALICNFIDGKAHRFVGDEATHIHREVLSYINPNPLNEEMVELAQGLIDDIGDDIGEPW